MNRLPIVIALALPLVACSSPAPGCRVNADCASGECDQHSLTCQSAMDAGVADAGKPNADDAGGSSTNDAGASDAGAADSGMTDDGGMSTGVCMPNHDGIIERSELPLQAGLSATYREASNVTVNTAGTEVDGGTVWDFSGSESGDQDAKVALEPIAGQWFADSFAGATYAAPLSGNPNLMGVFQLTNSALLMVGIVSPTSGTNETNLSYDPPVTVLKLPFKLHDTWETTSTVNGKADGFAAFYMETYTMTVDKSGTVVTPFATFPTLRVSTVLDQQVGAVITETRSFSFVAECFSAVVNVTSNPDELQSEFTTAAELQRLAP